MTFEELAKARYSVRKFQSKPVEREKLEKLLSVAASAPTGCNNQPQRLYVLTSDEAREKAAKCTKCTFGAPVLLLVCYDRNAAWKREFDGWECGVSDASIFATHLALEAAELGLGTCWVAWFDPAETRKQFDLPENIVPVAFLPLGYPDTAPAKWHGMRRAWSDYTTWK
ncbi:MAG: nitroreductase family protein [Kiritimatiellae bacterium]|nr:nitroreductase family protein [Kiritimatiellia bacterium]